MIISASFILLNLRMGQTHIFRTLRNTARVFKNKVAVEVVEKESKGAQFKDIQASLCSESLHFEQHSLRCKSALTSC